MGTKGDSTTNDAIPRIAIVALILIVLASCASDRDKELDEPPVSSVTEQRTIPGFKSDDATTFHGYDCTVDCSGHEAGYQWANEHEIEDENDCRGNSNSFVEGCRSYVEEHKDQSESGDDDGR